MTKDQIIEAIAKERAAEAETQLRIKNLRTELAKHAEFQKGDVVQTPKGIFKLWIVHMDDNGNLRTYFDGFKQLKGGEWGKVPTFIVNQRDWTLIDRPTEAK